MISPIDIFKDELADYTVLRLLSTTVNTVGREVTDTQELTFNLSVYNKGLTLNRSLKPSRKQQTIHIYSTTHELKENDSLFFKGKNYRVEHANNVNGYYFATGYTDE